MPTKAVIYCRVSSEKQKREGHGLDSQEHNCRQYAKNHDYDVVGVFKDDITGGLSERPGFTLMLEALTTLSEEKRDLVVIIDDIKRWARDVTVHWSLKKTVMKLGARIESPNYRFGESPEDHFIENVMAAQAELERKQNYRQVMQKMQARLERGYWTFDEPPGLHYIKDPVHGSILAPDEPKASIIREALLGFLSRRFETQTEVAAFLTEKEFTHRAAFKGKVHLGQVHRLLTRMLYAGWVEYPKWNVERRKGHHEGLISIEEFDAIQARLQETERTHQRKDAHEDFPLRSHLSCSTCSRLVTASWSRGRGKSYPYYRCTTRSCAQKNKGIRAEAVEKDFSKLLKKLTPQKESLDLVEAIFLDLWGKRMELRQEEDRRKLAVIKEMESEIETLCVRLGRVKGEILIRKYESRIEQLEEQKRGMERKQPDAADPRYDFGTVFKEVRGFIQKPDSLWKSDRFEDKRALLKLAFVGTLPYDKQTGFGTARFALPFELCRVAKGDKTRMVEMPGIEPGSNASDGGRYYHAPFQFFFTVRKEQRGVKK